MTTKALRISIEEQVYGISGETLYYATPAGGGPAARLKVTLDEYGDVETASLQFQDWFEPWTDAPGQDRHDRAGNDKRNTGGTVRASGLRKGRAPPMYGTLMLLIHPAEPQRKQAALRMQPELKRAPAFKPCCKISQARR